MEEVKVIPYKDVPGMFHLRWRDGTWSEDYYNKTWAKEHCARLNAEYNASVMHRDDRRRIILDAKLPPYLKTFKLTSELPNG